jgi:hypothetical protein
MLGLVLWHIKPEDRKLPHNSGAYTAIGANTMQDNDMYDGD